MIKGVIFDFDGVIVDSEAKKFNDIKKALLKRNLHLKKSDFTLFIGKKRGFFLKERFSELTASQIEEILSCLRETDYENLNKIKLISGTKQLLHTLKSKKYYVAIVTGTSRRIVKKILAMNRLDKYFGTIITGENTIWSKPNPEVYRYALKRMKLKPSEVIVIEDSLAGLNAAKEAGAIVYALTTYLTKKGLCEADNIFKDNTEIEKYFKKKGIIFSSYH